MKTIQIREYGTFVVGDRNGSNANGNITLTERTFEQLETFILSNSSKETDALELMGLSARRGVGKIITAKNYVGIITMNDGIEFREIYDDGVTVRIRFVDLFDIQNSINNLRDEFLAMSYETAVN